MTRAVLDGASACCRSRPERFLDELGMTVVEVGGMTVVEVGEITVGSGWEPRVAGAVNAIARAGQRDG
jgi:hypothetical protein